MFEIKRTKREDLSVIMRIVNMSKETFAEEGIDQWQKGYPKRDDFLQDMMMNESFAIFEDDCVVGTLMISKNPETTYKDIHQGTWLQDGPYAVVHRFTIDPISRRQGLATKTLEELERMLKSFETIKSIRMDTHKNNLGMQGLLEKLGYEYCGIIYLKNGDARYAYEKLI